mgnify:CR=1 FL=1
MCMCVYRYIDTSTPPTTTATTPTNLHEQSQFVMQQRVIQTTASMTSTTVLGVYIYIYIERDIDREVVGCIVGIEIEI